jgi:hypothetical protein
MIEGATLRALMPATNQAERESDESRRSYRIEADHVHEVAPTPENLRSFLASDSA